MVQIYAGLQGHAAVGEEKFLSNLRRSPRIRKFAQIFNNNLSFNVI